MRLGKTAIIDFLSQGLVSIAGFAATFAIARILGPSGLGKYAIAVALGIFWLSIPAGAVSSALTKRLSENRDRAEFLSSGLLLNLVLSIIIGLSVYLLRAPIGRYIGADVGHLVALLVVANIAFTTVRAGLMGQKKVATAGIMTAIERLSRTGLQIALIIIGLGVTGLILGHIASLVVIATASLIFYEITAARPTREKIGSMIEYARYSWIGGMQARVFGWMDTLILAFFVGSNLIGIYEAAWGIGSLLAMASGSIGRTLFPEISELSTEDRFDRIREYVNEIIVFSGIFIIPGFFGAITIGDRVLGIYRPEFTAGSIILVILVAANALKVYGSQFVNVINGIDRPNIAFRVNFIFIVMNILLNIGLIPVFGWYGAAIATLISTGLWLGLSYWYLSSLIGSPAVPLGELFREFIASVVMAGGIIIVEPVVGSHHFITLGLVLLGATIYAAVLLRISHRVRRKVWSLVPDQLHGSY